MGRQATRTLRREELSTLFGAHHDHVWTLARGLGASAERADELVGEVFVALARGLDQHPADRPLRPWLDELTHENLREADASPLDLTPEPERAANNWARHRQAIVDAHAPEAAPTAKPKEPSASRAAAWRWLPALLGLSVSLSIAWSLWPEPESPNKVRRAAPAIVAEKCKDQVEPPPIDEIPSRPLSH